MTDHWDKQRRVPAGNPMGGRWVRMGAAIAIGAGLMLPSKQPVTAPPKLSPDQHTVETKLHDYGITMERDQWRLDDQRAFLQEVETISERVGGAQNFNTIFGDMHVQKLPSSDGGISCWSWMTCYGDVQIDPDNLNHGLLSHELGHRFLNNLELRSLKYTIGYDDEDGNYVHVSGLNPITNRYERTSLGYPQAGKPYEQHGAAVSQSLLEDFADMFMAWTLGTFSEDEAGRARQKWMEEFVDNALKERGLK